MKRYNNTKKSTSRNEQFGASGGVVSYDTEQVTSSFALVRALPMPPPAPSCHHVSGKADREQRGAKLGGL